RDAGSGRGTAARPGAVKDAAVQRFRAGRDHAQAGEAIAGTDDWRALSVLRIDWVREVRDHGVQRDLRRDAEDREASGARRRDAAGASGCSQGVEGQQRPTAERNGRTDQAHDYREERSGGAPAAVRYQLKLRAISFQLKQETGGNRPSFVLLANATGIVSRGR